jgi:hypothetical protein
MLLLLEEVHGIPLSGQFCPMRFKSYDNQVCNNILNKDLTAWKWQASMCWSSRLAFVSQETKHSSSFGVCLAGVSLPLLVVVHFGLGITWTLHNPSKLVMLGNLP